MSDETTKYEPFLPVKTAADWKAIETELSPMQPIRFLMDGHKVGMFLVALRMQLVITFVIDGKLTDGNLDKEKPEIADKFYERKEYFKYKKQYRDYAVKWYGKKRAKEMGILEKGKYIQGYWTSFSRMKLHLMKTCTEIKVSQADLKGSFILSKIFPGCMGDIRG